MAAVARKRKDGRAKALPLQVKIRRFTSAKLRTASASVFEHIEDGQQLVICRTFLELLPRWQRRSAGALDLTL